LTVLQQVHFMARAQPFKMVDPRAGSNLYVYGVPGNGEYAMDTMALGNGLVSSRVRFNGTWWFLIEPLAASFAVGAGKMMMTLVTNKFHVRYATANELAYMKHIRLVPNEYPSALLTSDAATDFLAMEYGKVILERARAQLQMEDRAMRHRLAYIRDIKQLRQTLAALRQTIEQQDCLLPEKNGAIDALYQAQDDIDAIATRLMTPQ
jgi:hypothetical protein